MSRIVAVCSCDPINCRVGDRVHIQLKQIYKNYATHGTGQVVATLIEEPVVTGGGYKHQTLRAYDSKKGCFVESKKLVPKYNYCYKLEYENDAVNPEGHQLQNTDVAKLCCVGCVDEYLLYELETAPFMYTTTETGVFIKASAAGPALQLPDKPFKKAIIVGLDNNTGLIALGDEAGVNANPGSLQGTPYVSYQDREFLNSNLNIFWMDVENDGEGLTWTIFN